ncbi:MAG: PcfB family protein [Oscillospiraceae bacterium]|nr:PcfB family protein [Oscillospiraceae bacterium]
MHEEVNEKSIAFAMKAGKITAQMLAKAMQTFLNRQKSGKVKGGKVEPGKISMKQLAAESGGNVANIEITDKNIKSFDPIARKYGIRYKLMKAGNGRHYVFFNGKSVDAMTAAFKEFTAKQTRKASRPSMLTELRKLVEQVKNMAVNKTKHKDRGQEL